MPVLVEANSPKDPSNRLVIDAESGQAINLDGSVLIPGGFVCMSDTSSGELEMLGIVCNLDDGGQTILRIKEGIELSPEGIITLQTSELDKEENVVARLGEDSTYRDEIIDLDNEVRKVVSYHLGGLAAHYAARTWDRVNIIREET